MGFKNRDCIIKKIDFWLSKSLSMALLEVRGSPRLNPEGMVGLHFFVLLQIWIFTLCCFFLQLPVTLCNQDCYLGQKQYDLILIPDCTFITVHCTFTAAHNHHVLATEIQNQSQTFEYRHEVQSTVQFILAKNHPLKITVWRCKASMFFFFFLSDI